MALIKWLVIGIALALAGCTITRELQMYPDNDAAHALGPLKGQIVGHGNLNGVATMSLPDGRQLEGRYSISHGGSMSSVSYTHLTLPTIYSV